MGRKRKWIRNKGGKQIPYDWSVLEEKRARAVHCIEDLGYDVTVRKNGSIEFLYKGYVVIHWLKKEWSTGVSIRDCRGFKSLIKQIK